MWIKSQQKIKTWQKFFDLPNYNNLRGLMSLKEFTMLSKIGEGAYSSVYKVRRSQDGQIYALKKVKIANLSAKEQDNALNEVRILASVRSQYIVGYRHAFVEAGFLFIVMEFLDDGDLHQKIALHRRTETQFEESFIWAVLIQALQGLRNLHDLKIFHRDVKSANIFLSKEGTVKLGDMNVSKIAKNGLLCTQTGTPYYASPEVWREQPYDCKSDIWSLGCVIYQMTTLKPPFRAEDMEGLYKRVIKGSYNKIGDNYSKELSSVIKAMLQVNPSNRPTANQLLINLQSKALEYGLQLEQTAAEACPKTKVLLETIRPHQNLHYLTERLPKSNYLTIHCQQKHTLNLKSKSTKAKNLHKILTPIPNIPSKHINSKSIQQSETITTQQLKSNTPQHQQLLAPQQSNSNTLPIQSVDLPKLRAAIEQGPYSLPYHRKKLYSVEKTDALQNVETDALQNVETDALQNVEKVKNKHGRENRKILSRELQSQLRKIYNLKAVPLKKERPRCRIVGLPPIR